LRGAVVTKKFIITYLINPDVEKMRLSGWNNTGGNRRELYLFAEFPLAAPLQIAHSVQLNVVSEVSYG
jgi:hypothetical protein